MVKIFRLVACIFAGVLLMCSCADKPLFPEMPGMVSYTYRVSFGEDVAATLDTLQQMGIKDMEFSSMFGQEPATIRELLDERDMVCSTLGVGYNDLVNDTRAVGKNANTLGADFVRVASIPHSDPFDLEQVQKAVEDFNAAGKILKEEFGLTFCYHNHGFEFYPYQDGTLFNYLVENTNPEYVSFEMDVLWVHFPGADPVELLNKYESRFKLMHLKDLKSGVTGDLSGSTAKENDVALGTGQLDIPSILKAAKRIGIKHYYIEDESPVYFEQVPQSIKYLHALKY